MSSSKKDWHGSADKKFIRQSQSDRCVMQVEDARKKELCSRLIDAVKQCQIRFGDRREIASDSESSVVCLLTAWENVLNDGLKIEADEQGTSLAVLNTVSRLASNIPIIGDTVSRTTNYTAQQFRPATSVNVASVSFYVAVRELISESERRRFESLANVHTQLGRARSFLRAALNEKTLERTVRKLLSSTLSRFYHPTALLCDTECAAVLPSLAAGLESVVFALSLDRAPLDTVPIAVLTVPTPIERSSNTLLDEPNRANVQESEQQSQPIAIGKVDESGLRPRLAFGSLVELASSAFSTSFTASPSNAELNVPQLEPVSVAVGIELSRNPPAANAAQSQGKRRKRPTVISFDEDGQAEQPKASERADLEASQPIKVTNGGATTTSSSSGIGSVEVGGTELPQPTEDGPQDSRSAARRSRLPPSFEEESATFSALSLSRLIPLQLAGSQPDVAESVSSVSSQLRQRMHNSIYEEPPRDEAAGVVHFQLDSDADALSGEPTVTNVPRASITSLSNSTLSHIELKQALVAVIQRKDDAERRVAELKENIALLEDQLLSAKAQAEEERVAERNRADTDRQTMQTLRRENELLRTQLKKYIGTVQSLKRAESTSNAVSLDAAPSTALRDYSFEAEQFEGKLVKMAELHGELLEFNDALQRELRKRDTFVRHVHRRLVELRGPLPPDEELMFQMHLGTQWTDELATSGASVSNAGARSPSVSSASSLAIVFPSTRPLVNIWIPNVYLIREPHDVHHVFQIYARVGDEEWNVFRRYSEFVDFHQKLVDRERPDAATSTNLRLPPKKALGNRDAKFVEERRARLQTYLRNVVNHLLTRYPNFAAGVNKRTLADRMPILDECVRERTHTDLDASPPSATTSSARSSFSRQSSLVDTRSARRSVADVGARRSSQPGLQPRRSFPNVGFRT